MAQQTDSVRRSLDYVNQLSDDCARTDGYECIKATETDFLSADSDGALIPGRYFEAWSVSYQDFRSLTELTEEQKQLKHYKIGFTENADQYIVLFRGLLLPRITEEGNLDGVLRVTFGRTTKYWIDKKDFAITKRLFYR